jgi:glutamyl-Q tRNA(Asp) synthetase
MERAKPTRSRHPVAAAAGVRPRVRFAPSPNGWLHLGHALAALTAWERARAVGGQFLLRIEDLDVDRTRSRFVQGIFTDLRWLGIAWEEPVLFQSQRFDAYRAAARRLAAMGLLYPCFATRSEIAAAGGVLDPDGAPLYPGLWKGAPRAELERRLQRGEPHVLRLDVTRAAAIADAKLAGVPLTFTEWDAQGSAHTLPARPEMWGDAVLVRKDVPASYHLAVVVDDAAQGITCVTRGRDLLAATHLHRLLQVLLDLPAPDYHHHRLITDASGRKLAKSSGDVGLRALRAAGLEPKDVCRLIGLEPEARR